MSEQKRVSKTANLPQTKQEEEALARQIAGLVVQGKNKYNISQELQLTRYMVGKYMRHSVYKNTLKEIAEDAVQNAKAYIRQNLERMAPKALTALEANLEKESIEGVKTYFRAIGALDVAEDGSDKKQAQLNVIFPGMPKQPKDVKSDVEDK